MKVIISGAAGFLGSHLVEYFLRHGHTVIGLDDLSTGSVANISRNLDHKKFSFIEHDVRNPFNIETDLILNFACPASPIHYQSDPVKTLETNILGITNVLHLAKKYGSRVLQASTSEVYGDPKLSPQSEEYWGNVNPIGLRSCYDEGKRVAETLCFDYQRQFGIDSRVVRIFNTYGPNMAVNDGRVVSNLIVQALKDEPLTLYGDGQQSRSFCYVDDLVMAIYSMATAEKNFYSPINIGNPNEISMLVLSDLILNLTNSQSKIQFLPLPTDDPKQRCPDITKARESLNWNPEIELSEGLKRTIDYFRTVI